MTGIENKKVNQEENERMKNNIRKKQKKRKKSKRNRAVIKQANEERQK